MASIFLFESCHCEHDEGNCVSVLETAISNRKAEQSPVTNEQVSIGNVTVPTVLRPKDYAVAHMATATLAGLRTAHELLFRMAYALFLSSCSRERALL